jgi:hypothetical protein
MRIFTGAAIVFCCVTVLNFTPVHQCAGNPGGTTLYVSLQGRDTSPGTLNKPFRTLERARDAVRALKKADGGLRAPVTILLRGGTYTLSQPFVLLPEDGGTPDCPVTYAAYPEESPVLSGGMEVKNWRPGTINGRHVWSAQIGKIKFEGGRLRQLWVNGARRSQARYPNRGYLHVAKVPDVKPETPWNEGQWSFVVAPGAMGNVTSFAGSECVLMNRWTESHLPVTGWNPDSSILHFGLRTIFRTEPGDPYYFLNVPGSLDTAGEWLWDSAHETIHYIPVPGEDPGRVSVVIPGLSRLLIIKGDTTTYNWVEHLAFRGITFSHNEWGFDGGTQGPLLEPHTGGFGQAAVGLCAAIEAHGLRYSRFDNCSVVHSGTYGLALMEGSRSVVVSQCAFRDLGGGGIKIGETSIPADSSRFTSHNTILDCTIADAGLVFHSAIGIWVGQSPANKIIHNEIFNLYYSGISVGWTWGYGPSIASNTLVLLNHIHHIGVKTDGDGYILADMGGIYTVGTRWQTMIRRNVFHDIGARLYGGWGIYYDEGTMGAISEDNVVYNTSHEGFHQHYGRENVFRNNVIAYSRQYQVRISRAEPHLSFAFEKNIVTWDGGPMFAERDSGTIGLFDNNLYWFAGGTPLMMEHTTFAPWQAMGKDRHSMIADPMFRGPRNGDFTFPPDSPARKLGIHQPEVAKALDRTPLTPNELAALTGPQLPGRLLYNNDGSNILMSCDTLTPSRAYVRIDPLAGAGVSLFIHNVNPGQNMGYPSAVAPMFHWERSPEKPKESWDTYGTRMDYNLRSLVRDSIDAVGMVMQRAWFRGMGAFLSLRLNDLHDVDKPDSPLLSPFWKSHPDYRVGGYSGWGAYALNYAIPQVREYTLAILREVCERYDPDGLELDFMRFPYYFPPQPDSMKAYTNIMTQFVRTVRVMTEAIAERRGRPLLLSVRVPTSLEACAYIGVDPSTWAKEELIDLLVIAPFLSTQPEMPVSEFRQACGSIPIYAGIEYTLGTRSMLHEQIRAVGALLYAAGADGIYLFNHFTYWDTGRDIDKEVLRELSDPQLLAAGDKLYTLAPTRHPIPNVTPASPMPLVVPKMETRTVTLTTAEALPAVTVILRVECKNEVSPGKVRVWFNVVEQGSGVHPADSLMFPQPVDFVPAERSHVLEFRVDPRLLRVHNTLTFLATEDVQIDYVHVAVKHGG